jgi:hypothetical protein
MAAGKTKSLALARLCRDQAARGGWGGLRKLTPKRKPARQRGPCRFETKYGLADPGAFLGSMAKTGFRFRGRMSSTKARRSAGLLAANIGTK